MQLLRSMPAMFHELFIQFPRLAAVAGPAVTLASLYFGAGAWNDLARYRGGAASVSLREALERSARAPFYAEVRDANLDCASARSGVPRDGHFLVPVTDRDHQIVAIASYELNTSCPAIGDTPLVGDFMPLHPRYRATLARAGVVLPNGTRDFCSHCGPTNASLGVTLCGLFAVLGIVFYPLARFAHRVMAARLRS